MLVQRAPRSCGEKGHVLSQQHREQVTRLGDTEQRWGPNLGSKSCVLFQICTGTAGEEEAFWLPCECKHTAHREIPRYQLGKGLWGPALPFWHETPHFFSKGFFQKGNTSSSMAGSSLRVSHVPRAELSLLRQGPES